jgi:cold shock CspA family protein
MSIGRVKFFDVEKQYGFAISDAPSEPEVFIHANSLKGVRVLVSGDKISYDIQESRKYPGRFNASNVRLLD